MAWNLDSDRPIYTQILEIIEIRIISGLYKLGDKIPSVRELAAEAGVNPNTMQKALSELERGGLIITQRTTGRTVTEDESLVEKLRNEIAQNQLHIFVDKMKELGFEKKDIIALLEKSEN